MRERKDGPVAARMSRIYHRCAALACGHATTFARFHGMSERRIAVALS